MSKADEARYDRHRGPRDRTLRVADSERDAVSAILRREHVAGRLDADEFEERLARCLTAKTYAELDALIGDFPEPEPPGPRRARRLWPFPVIPIVPIAVAAIVLSHGRAAWLAVPLVIFFVARPRLGARRRGGRFGPPRGPRYSSPG